MNIETQYAMWNGQNNSFLVCTYSDKGIAENFVRDNLNPSFKNEVVEYGSVRYGELAKLSSHAKGLQA